MILALAAVLLPLAFFCVRRRNLVAVANTYDAAVETHECSVRRTNDAAITARHLLWKQGATDGGIALCGATDTPLGTVDNTETSTGVGQALLLLGKGPTKKMVASVAVTAGARLYTAASGKVSVTSGAGKAFVGIALTACSADNDIIEVADASPVVMAA